MNGMFYNCRSLQYLPDISKWNTYNVKDMGSMFYNCSSLIYLPDFLKWDLKNNPKMGHMFPHCFSVINLPYSFYDRDNLTLGQLYMFSDTYDEIIEQKLNT